VDVKKLLQNIGVVSIVLAGARIFGFVREVIIVPRFGLSNVLDAWNIASTIPMVIALLLTTGVISAVFIPIFTKYIVNSDYKGLSKLIGVLSLIITVGFSVLVVIGFVFAKPIILLQTKPSTPPLTIDTAVRLFKIMMPTVLIMAWAGLLTAIHHSFNSFVRPAIGGLLLNVAVIGALYVLPRSAGVDALAWGFLAGSILQLLIQVPGIFSKKMKLDVNCGFKHPALAGVVALILPVLLGSGIQQIRFFFEKYLASGVAVGAVTAYTEAWKVGQLPLSIFVMTVSMVVFPLFAESVARNKPEALKRNVLWGMKLVSFIIIPAAIGVLVLSEPISVTLFMRGAVNFEQALRIAGPLAFFAVGLLPWAFAAILLKVFYSLGDTKTPVWIACITVPILVILELILVRWGVIGIAVGSVIAAFITMFLQVTMIRKKIGNFGLTSLIISVIKSTISAGVMGVAVFFISQKSVLLVDMTSNTGRILALTFSIVIGVVIYISMMYLINREELKSVFSGFTAKKASA
jgi:putative peptidoglycan lipid II flippase